MDHNKFFTRMHIITCVTIVALASITLAEGYVKTSEAKKGGIEKMVEQDMYVNITAYNPYNISVKIETKCDWNPIKRTYGYYKTIEIPAKKNVVLSIPKTLLKCELWPKILFWG